MTPLTECRTCAMLTNHAARLRHAKTFGHALELEVAAQEREGYVPVAHWMGECLYPCHVTIRPGLRGAYAPKWAYLAWADLVHVSSTARAKRAVRHLAEHPAERDALLTVYQLAAPLAEPQRQAAVRAHLTQLLEVVAAAPRTRRRRAP